MDFLKEAIQEEVNKKRKLMEAVEKRGGTDKKLKYVSRAELERIREEEYRQKEKEREEKERQVMCFKYRLNEIILIFLYNRKKLVLKKKKRYTIDNLIFF